MSNIFHTFLVNPLYNLLVLILEHASFSDLGLAIIILTLIVRFVLYPLSKSSIKTQLKMKELQGPMDEIKAKYKGDQQQLALATMKLYKDNNIKPFSGILLLFIQIPIIFALYYVITKEGLPQINTDLLYSFVSAPSVVGSNFLGIFELTSKSIVLAILAGAAQFLQAKIMLRKNGPMATSTEKNFQNDLMKSMQIQMQYVLPGIMIALAYTFGSVVALYFITGSIFSIAQELYLKKKFSKELVQNVQAPQS